MPQRYTFICPLPNGMHVRPASCLAEVAAGFKAEIRLVNQRTGTAADVKSVLALIATAIGVGDSCELTVSGEDEAAALQSLRRFIEHDLAHTDEPLAAPSAEPQSVALPPMLRKAAVKYLAAKTLSRGIGQGAVVIFGGLHLPEALPLESPSNLAEARAKVDQALAAVRGEIQAKLAGTASATESAILKAHLAIAGDSLLMQEIHNAIDAGRGAAQAVAHAGVQLAAWLKTSESLYIRERAIDVQDICALLLERICGEGYKPAATSLHVPSIVVAENLSPRQFLALDRTHLRGLVLGQSGETSHTVILARSFNIPTLANVKDLKVTLSAGQQVIVDGDLGILIVELSAPVQRYYELESRKHQRRRARLLADAQKPAMTTDGQRLEVGANVATAEESTVAFERGAEGIGIFRTEMLFLDRDSPPTEEEQFAVYRGAAESAAGRPVIIRTLDIGGDKPLAYLDQPAEPNPFLGCRGVRLYEQHLAIFQTQVRAILRASAFGAVQLMLPMIATLDEVRWCKARIAEVRAELQSKGTAHNPAMPIGIMVEAPSVAFILDQFCDEAPGGGAAGGGADFFSIGTNDLTQYFLAADRENPGVASLYNPRHPSFLRLLKRIVDEAHSHGKWVGVCGEMAGEIRHLPLLLGLGVDEISMGAGQIPAAKSAISRLEGPLCRQALADAMACRSVGQVDALLAELQQRDLVRPLLDSELILTSGELASKEEAIKQIADTFFVAGRTDAPSQIEEAVWAREAVYSTGLGHGFAIPHCKSDAIAANSIGVLKLNEPIEWGSLDGKPVQMVILLAMRESDKNNAHMKVFSVLARKLMHEEFRDRLLAAADAATVGGVLKAELGIE